MRYYYMVFQNKAQAFLLEERLKAKGITCEVTYVPREIMSELCGLGLRFPEREFGMATGVIRSSGLKRFRLFLEVWTSVGNQYQQIVI